MYEVNVNVHLGGRDGTHRKAAAVFQLFDRADG